MPRSLLYFAAFTGMGTVFAATLLVAALIMSSISPAQGQTPPSSDPDPTASPTPAADGPIGEITITAFDLGFEPAMVHVPEPGTYTVTFVNDGGIFHDVAFDDGTVIGAEGHETATGEVTIPAGGMGFICSVPGHADGGMRGEVVVDASANPDPSHGGDEERTPQEMVDIDAARTAQFPAETEGRGNVVLEPEIDDEGVLNWELTASVIEWETEPGKVLEAFAYNGMVPGPQLRAEVGDTVRIVLRNELEEPTTIHWHGLYVPPNMDGVPVISQDAVLPGDTFTYEFTLRNAGSHMYHSHFMAEHQVPMGLLGAFVVTDPENADPDLETDYDYAMILNDGPLGFTLNGKGFPATEPIVMKQGETIRIRYMNEGLQIHPMHLHGIPQLVVAKDGWDLPTPHWEDTVLVSPGERVDVIVEATELGVWAFHCHVLTHAEGPDGMFGMVTAVIVEE
ncbi:MAG TPA: multicopper oxidase domain-containing protein [Candidatus Angelobacter sp.]|nr:multicopper oxidase domain-containing protein [Candidatus Angelobacter sp.]